MQSFSHVNELERHHLGIEAAIAEMRRHLALARPDIGTLGMARVALSRLSTSRSKFVNDEIVPMVCKEGDAEMRARMNDMQKAFSAKRLLSSKHVTTWSTATIVGDWSGYRVASRKILEMMEDQIERERHILLSALRGKKV